MSRKEDIVKMEAEKWLKLGIVEPSNSPWSSPVVLVPKKAINPEDPTEERRFRLCVDFRKLNTVTKTDCFPLLALDSLGQAYILASST